MTASQPRVPSAQLIRRIRGEFNEMPGLCLTMAQAKRLWGLDAESCAAVVQNLIDAGFLRRINPDKYSRADGATAFPPPRMAKIETPQPSAAPPVARRRPPA